MTSKIDVEAINAILAVQSSALLSDAQLGWRSNSGIPASEAQKRAVSAANKGVTRSRASWTDERKAAASVVAAARIADRNARREAGEEVGVYSDEARRNIGLAAKGRKPSPEALKKRSESMKRTLALKRGIGNK